VWRKGFELQQAVAQKGVERVLEELSKSRGKPLRELGPEAGRQVTGTVVLTFKQQDGGTGVVIDTGRELTVLRQPAPEDVPMRHGARVRATVQQAQQVVAGNQRRQQNVWRFADLERTAAMAKDKAKGRDLF
jgi:hypothetical protein